jgi:hypothetical protein
MSEGGKWKNGAADGVDWTNCRTRPGLVFGTEDGAGRGVNQYDDSTCILTGAWGPLQNVQGTVFSRNQSDAYFQEVELRLHSTMTAHSCTGYEVLFRAYHPGGYATIVRWNGALGSFTYLNQKTNGNYKGIQTGDIVKATIDSKGLIIGFVNGVEVIRATDTTYARGNPGIGFWLLARGGRGKGTNADYGFSAFTATDGLDGGSKGARGEVDERGVGFHSLQATAPAEGVRRVFSTIARIVFDIAQPVFADCKWLRCADSGPAPSRIADRRSLDRQPLGTSGFRGGENQGVAKRYELALLCSNGRQDMSRADDDDPQIQQRGGSRL